MAFLEDWKRDCYCAQVTQHDANRTMTLMGWVQRRRDFGEIIFVWLRDRTGLVQIVFEKSDNPALFLEADAALRNECVIAVRGEIALRTKENINPDMETGMVEMRVHELKILSTSEVLPFPIEDETNASELTRMKYRYLDLRRPVMQNIIKTRHLATQTIRRYLDERGFIEIETPILMRSTPEGARDYLVPSRLHKGEFYALPQSPQLLKQILMVSGFDKYYQLARCFRDEDLRADRQPEFTQIDIEMSFVEMEDIMQLSEGLLNEIFLTVLGHEMPKMVRMPYAQAMAQYGSDKPDIRFGLTLTDVSAFGKNCGFSVFENARGIQALNVKGSAKDFSRKELDRLAVFVKQFGAKGLAWAVLEDGEVRSSFAKNMHAESFAQMVAALQGETGDLLLFIADESAYAALIAMGQLRLELGKRLNLYNPDAYAPLWVTEFPFFELDEETGKYLPMHHPFTCPLEEDMEFIETEPGRVRAKCYDIVINGVELASGSIRIHSKELQERMFSALDITMEEAHNKFGYLLEAFQYGPPPHGGIAPGLDRLLMLLLKTESIREIVAFPKLQNASDPLTGAPGKPDAAQLKELGITILSGND